MEEKLKELKEIMYQYDNFCSLWIDGEDAEDYIEEMDDLRNKGFEIIEELNKRLTKPY